MQRMGSSHPEECTSNPIWKVIGYSPIQKEEGDTIITHPVWQVDIEVYRIYIRVKLFMRFLSQKYV